MRLVWEELGDRSITESPRGAYTEPLRPVTAIEDENSSIYVHIPSYITISKNLRGKWASASKTKRRISPSRTSVWTGDKNLLADHVLAARRLFATALVDGVFCQTCRCTSAIILLKPKTALNPPEIRPEDPRRSAMTKGFGSVTMAGGKAIADDDIRRGDVRPEDVGGEECRY